MSGDTVYKTGRSTGTTAGPLLSTCITTPPDSVSHESVDCANEAVVAEEKGDSGGPVYYTVFRLPYVVPEGIAWGQARIGLGATMMLYSQWATIADDLGVFMTPY